MPLLLTFPKEAPAEVGGMAIFKGPSTRRRPPLATAGR
jgi:hypothetical protein